MRNTKIINMLIRLSSRAFLLGSLLCALVASVHAQDIRTIGQLARDGAPGLALKLLDEVQPDADENIKGWMFFEKQRIDIMRDWQQWNALTQRLETLPDNIPPAFERATMLERVNAFLQQSKGDSARLILRQLLWLPPAQTAAAQFELYRRLVIRSYLVEDNIKDAQTAMFRYQQDYGNKGLVWQLLRARILLQTGSAADVVNLLAGQKQAEAMALRLLAELRSGKRTAKSVLADARKLATQKDLALRDQVRFWYVAAEAARSFAGYLTTIRVLEKSLLKSHVLPAGDNIFRLSGGDLWTAYQLYAKETGNALQLLIGDDALWLKTARQWQKKHQEKARAFYAFVIEKGVSAEQKKIAARALTDSLLASKEGVVLLRKLFLDNNAFTKADRIPDSIRYLLVDDALKRNEIDTATRLMANLEKPPENAPAFEWALRRSRVLVLGGRYREGIAILQSLLKQEDVYQKEKIDRVLQVIFDLQAVGKHQDAINLLENIGAQSLELKLQRELLFWTADSYRSMDNYAQAASLYLQSATLLDGKGFDPWGQTARFHAAEVLADAGLAEDAKRLYEGLLRVTAEADRRAMLKYKLQELWLK